LGALLATGYPHEAVSMRGAMAAAKGWMPLRTGRGRKRQISDSDSVVIFSLQKTPAWQQKFSYLKGFSKG